MTGRRSPLEIAAVTMALALFVGVVLLWGVGIVVGSILGSTLPGRGQGPAPMLNEFPDVGRAWQPAIPSEIIWTAAIVLVLVFAPLVWRLMRAGSLADEGAKWATTPDLRKAGVLVPDYLLAHAEAEESSHAA